MIRPVCGQSPAGCPSSVCGRGHRHLPPKGEGFSVRVGFGQWQGSLPQSLRRQPPRRGGRGPCLPLRDRLPRYGGGGACARRGAVAEGRRERTPRRRPFPGLALDSAHRDALREVLLEGQEHDDDGHGCQRGTGHDQAVVGGVLGLQLGDT